MTLQQRLRWIERGPRTAQVVRTLEEQWRTRGEGDWIESLLQAHVANREQRLAEIWM